MLQGSTTTNCYSDHCLTNMRTLSGQALERSSNMLEACRTCLRLIDVVNMPFYEIETEGVQLSTESSRYKLLSILPEMALDITPKSMICAECHGSLEALFKFKATCLKTEDFIMQYLQAKPDVDIKTFDLKDVLIGFDGVDNNDAKDHESSIKNATFTEEEKSCDISEELVSVDESITIVKHEVDNYLPESVELVHPENKVLESKEKLGKGKLKCSICPNSFLSKIALTRHMVYIHKEERPYKCHICSKDFIYTSSLKEHLQIHSGIKNYECKMCKKKFRRRRDMMMHQKIHSGNKNFKCEFCNKCYYASSKLKLHLSITHATEKPYQKYHLKNHMPTHNDENPYKCEICQKNFSKQGNLALHRKKHSDVKNFRCEYCNRSFSCNSRLKSHLKKHTGERLYRCEICDKRFLEKRHLVKHIRTHSGERPYECKTCRKNFAYSSTLAVHEKLHLNIKDFECEYCKKRFVRKQYLLNHITVHTRQQSFLCHICKMMFTSKPSAKKHIRRRHKDVDINTAVIEQIDHRNVIAETETQEK